MDNSFINYDDIPFNDELLDDLELCGDSSFVWHLEPEYQELFQPTVAPVAIENVDTSNETNHNQKEHVFHQSINLDNSNYVTTNGDEFFQNVTSNFSDSLENSNILNLYEGQELFQGVSSEIIGCVDYAKADAYNVASLESCEDEGQLPRASVSSNDSRATEKKKGFEVYLSSTFRYCAHMYIFLQSLIALFSVACVAKFLLKNPPAIVISGSNTCNRRAFIVINVI